MKSFIFQLIILLICLSSSSYAVGSDKDKLNYTLLTDDYGILHTRKKSKMPKTTKHPKVKLDGASGAVYWQCFKRDDVVLNLIDLGYSSDEKGWNENYGDVKISVYPSRGISHEYITRRLWPTSGYLKKFQEMLEIMKEQQYVCIAGNYLSRAEVTRDHKNEIVHTWVFEMIKTKKGCQSYFQGFCDRI